MARYDELDAVRGLAALVVVANHAFNLVPGDNWNHWLVQWTPLGRLISGDVAVAVFFVLSGFVLSIPLVRAQPTAYGPFLIRRFFRIYPPFAVAVLIAAALAAWLASPQAGLAIDESEWIAPVTWSLLLQHLVMIGVGHESVSLNMPMWTLIQELRVALVLPVLVFFIGRFGVCSLAATIVLAGIASKVPGFHSAFGDTVIGSFALTVYCAWFFALGSFLYINRNALIALVRLVPFRWHAALVLALAFYPRALVGSYLVSQTIFALFASYVIVLCIAFPERLGSLRHTGLQWLGRVSYSLYLVHQPVMLALKYAFFPALPLIVIIPASVALSLLAAEIFHRLVEVPSMRLGHHLSARRARPIASDSPV